MGGGNFGQDVIYKRRIIFKKWQEALKPQTYAPSNMFPLARLSS